MEDIGIFDFVIFTIFGLSIIIGVLRGFVAETFSILNLLLAAVVVYLTYDTVDGYLTDAGWTTNISKFLVAVCAVFVVAWIFFSSINSFLKGFFKSFKGTIVDRTLGVIFGFLRAVVISVIGFFILHLVHGSNVDNHPEMLTEARTYNFVRATSESLLERFAPGLYSENSEGDTPKIVKDAQSFIEGIMLSDDEKEGDEGDYIKLEGKAAEEGKEILKSVPDMDSIDKAFGDVMQENN